MWILKFTKHLYIFVIFIVFSLFDLNYCFYVPARDPSKPLAWWQKTVFYQAYPWSFKDSNADGVGDLKGIEQQVEYLKDIGIGAIWLNPIYKSPMKDFGYDISNYTELFDKFGTMDDLKSLKKALNESGIKLLLDFVPNHTSDQSEWFKKSIKREEPYTNFYIWKNPKRWEADNKPVPPNNWISVLNVNRAWSYNKERQQFYLHEFLHSQPDLNYRCKEVRKAMEDVIKFWLDAGVDGFRIDSVTYLVENEHYPDEAYKDPKASHFEYSNLIHNYTMDQPLSFEIVHSWRKILDDYSAEHNVDERVMLTEAYTNLNATMKYYGTEKHPISQMPFNFQLITNIKEQSNAKDIRAIIEMWFEHMPKGKWANWVIGNHDNLRVAARYGSELVDGWNMLMTLLPGTAFTYYGEELGMEDTFVRWDQTVDPQGIVLGKDNYLKASRDPARTPMQWNDSFSAGFSTGNKTWLPVNPNFWTLNAKKQKSDENSHLNVYKRLIEARKLPTIQYGDMRMFTPDNWTLIFTRSLENHTTFVVVINMATEFAEPDLSSLTDVHLPKELIVYAASVNSGNKIGDKISTAPNGLTLRSKAALVLTTSQVSSASMTTSTTMILLLTLLIRNLI